jgi:hypothetical protein
MMRSIQMQKDTVEAELKKLHSPDVSDLRRFRPVGPFGILVQAMVGPQGDKGEESFDIMVCTPDWFAANMDEEIVNGRHYLFVKQYDYPALRFYIEDFCKSCKADSWRGVAEKLSRLGHWEFEDYDPKPNRS